MHELFPQGEVLAETAISTTDGVKVTDAAWLSNGRTQELDSGPCLIHAPEICIEVLSPSNSQLEMAEKRALFFEARAAEVWICGLDGSMTFHLRPGVEQSDKSALCPYFQGVIEFATANVRDFKGFGFKRVWNPLDE